MNKCIKRFREDHKTNTLITKYTIQHCTKHLEYTYFENDLIPTSVIQQRQHVDGRERRISFGRVTNMFVFDILQIPGRCIQIFVRGAFHPLATPWLRAWCVLWYYHSKPVVTVQRLRKTYGRKPPAKMSNYKWHRLFSKTGCIREGTRPSKRPLTEGEVNEVRVRFVCCPNKRRRLRLPTSVRVQSTVHETLPTL